jgi:type I restriction enzyme S subunit
MEVTPGYKQTEVGILPQDWCVITASDACSKIQDGTHFSPRQGGHDYLYVTSKNVGFGYLDVSSASRIDTDQHRAIYKRCDVGRGDLLLTKDGANTGNAALNTLDEEFSLLSSVAFLRFQPDNYAAYFLQQVLTSRGQRQIKDAMAGNAITRLTLAKIKKLRFPVPPTKTEQEAIAEALGDADALIESLEQLIEKKRKIKQGAMQELLTGKKRLPGFENLIGCKQTEAGVIPRDWEVRTIGHLAIIKTGPFGTLLKASEYSENGVPLISVGEIREGYLRITENTPRVSSAVTRRLPQYVLRTGDIVFGRKGGVQRSVLIRPQQNGWFLGSDGITVRPTKDCHNAYLALQFQSARVREWLLQNAIGTTMPSLNQDILRNVAVPVPPTRAEQECIAAVLNDMDADLAALEGKLGKARQLKHGMMQELLTGRTRLV